VHVFARQTGQICSQCAGICADIRKDHEREASAWR
jgi:hypothetical protein